jgi:hypothetical protein
MSASPLNAPQFSFLNASNPGLPFGDAALVPSCKSVFAISALNDAARCGATAFVPATEDVQARLQQLQDKRFLLLKHIAQSERLAEVRPASRLEVRRRPEMIASGVAEVDAITGGIPRGCLTEIWGGASSGKTSVLVATMAAATRRGESCVLIDASDSFDPGSAEAAGMNFGKLLWVRCGERKPSSVSSPCSEQANTGHRSLCSRQLSAVSRQEKQSGSRASGFGLQEKTKKHSERRLEQVLKATDLILQSGGFGLIVLDLAGIAEKFVRRIPLASWFRFQRAVEHTKSALLVVSETPCAQTCATLGLRTKQSAFSAQQLTKPTHAELLDVMRIEAEVTRSRLERKPAQSVRAEFATQAVRLG